MARKSRSKQRGKGVGSRSQSAGKSKGGSRSSAGSKGGSKSGGNKSGSGKSSSKSKGSSKSKSTSSKSSNKGGSGGRNNPSTNRNTNAGRVAAKSPAPKPKAPAPKPKAPAPKPKSPTPKPKPKTTPAPKTKKELTPVQQRFKEREAKGLDGLTGMRKVTDAERKQGVTQLTQYRAAQKEQVRNAAIARNAANVTGIPSGDNLKAGSFGISEEGKALAAQQRAEAAAKKAAEQKAAEQKAAAEKKAADEKLARQFDPKRLLSGVNNAFTGENLSSGDLRNPLNASNYLAAAGAGYTDAVVGGVNFVKNLIPGAKQLPNIPTLPKYADKNLQNVRNISAVGIPLAQGVGAAKRFMSVDPVSGKAGFANEIAKMTVSDAAFKAGKVPKLTKTGISNVSPLTFAKAFTPQMVATGPTAGASLALSGAMLGGQAEKAGGLNIGSTGGVDSGETKGSTVGRAINFVRNNPLAIGKDLATLNNQLNTGELTVKDIAQGVGDYRTVMAGKDFRQKVENFADLPNERKEKYLTKGLELADKSAIVQNLGERAGLPADFKAQTKELGGELERRISTVKAGDRDSTYKAISDFARDIGTDPKLSLAGRLAESFRTREGTTMEKIAAGYDKNAPTVKGLSAAERGVVGSIGNRIISGKATDMAREAMSNMTPGSSLTRGNVANIASNIIRDTAPGADTVSAKRASEIKSLVTGGRGRRDITPGSLIRGVNPFRGSNRGGGSTPRTPAFTPSGGGTPVGQVPQIPATGTVPQFQVPELPEFPVQRGTDPSNLANIQKESYQNTFKNLMAINPNYSARFQMRRRRGGKRGSFKRAFSRRFFS